MWLENKSKLVLASLLVLGLAGCGSQKVKETSSAKLGSDISFTSTPSSSSSSSSSTSSHKKTTEKSSAQSQSKVNKPKHTDNPVTQLSQANASITQTNVALGTFDLNYLKTLARNQQLATDTRLMNSKSQAVQLQRATALANFWYTMFGFDKQRRDPLTLTKKYLTMNRVSFQIPKNLLTPALAQIAPASKSTVAAIKNNHKVWAIFNVETGVPDSSSSDFQKIANQINVQ